LQPPRQDVQTRSQALIQFPEHDELHDPVHLPEHCPVHPLEQPLEQELQPLLPDDDPPELPPEQEPAQDPEQLPLHEFEHDQESFGESGSSGSQEVSMPPITVKAKIGIVVFAAFLKNDRRLINSSLFIGFFLRKKINNCPCRIHGGQVKINILPISDNDNMVSIYAIICQI